MNTVPFNCDKGTKRKMGDTSNTNGLREFQKKKHNISDGTNLTELVKKYNDFHIKEEGCVIEQIFNLQVIVGQIEKYKIPLPEKFQIGMLIAKLPPSWHDFATSIWQHGENISMVDLVDSIIEENARVKNNQNTLQNLENEDEDIEACWACNKLGYTTDSCGCRMSLIQKEILSKDVTAPQEYKQNSVVEKERCTIPELPKECESEIMPNSDIISSNKNTGSGVCWSCRKMGYTTDICMRQRNKNYKVSLRKKNHRSEIKNAKKRSKKVLRACWTCRKKSYMSVCLECQKNIIEVPILY